MHHIDMPVDYRVDLMGYNAGTLSKTFWPTLLSWRLLHWMICHRNSLIRQSYHFATDFDYMLLQLVDILNTLFKYW